MLEVGGIVAFDPSRQDDAAPMRAPGAPVAPQLLDHAQHAVSSAQLHSRSDVLPSEQKLRESGRRYGLDSLAHAAQGQAMNPRQQHSITHSVRRRLRRLRSVIRHRDAGAFQCD